MLGQKVLFSRLAPLLIEVERLWHQERIHVDELSITQNLFVCVCVFVLFYYCADLHAMDCIDIVIGTAKGQLSRIGDYYTRDR